jgi:RNA polymerase sigma-70 factor
MSAENLQVKDLQPEDFHPECESAIDEIFARCLSNAPNFDVSANCFKSSLQKTVQKFCQIGFSKPPTVEEVKDFLSQIQSEDLFLALACANGNERAWWEFDQQHRAFIERIARHLARTDIDAQEVVDTVYIELYGTRVVDGERVSKFATYSGRGSLRGWLRTVIWHSVVDLHRASHDEISLDELNETVGESFVQANFSGSPLIGENRALDEIARKRYRKVTLEAIENAFANLDNHEKLLLLYYHVENLKLREIARFAEASTSPLRGWFQRRSTTREQNPTSRIHESTVMRWLEKCYGKVLDSFRRELESAHKLSFEEIEICIDLATEDLASPNIYRNLTTT